MKNKRKKSILIYIGIYLVAILLTGTLLETRVNNKLSSWEEWSDIPGGADAGYKDYETLVDSGQISESELYGLMINNSFSTPVIEQILRDGYCQSYIPQLKSQGWIPQDFTLDGGSDNTSQPSQEPAAQPDNSDNSQSQPSQQQQPQQNNKTLNSGNTTNHTTKTEDSGKQAENTPEVTIDDSVNGSYVVVEDTTSTEGMGDGAAVSELKKGDQVNVTGKSNTGYLRINKDGKDSYLKEEQATDQASYDSAWSEVERKDPTCTEDGYVKSHNSISNEDKEETLPKTGHDYETTKTVDPTCTDDGYKLETCKVCGNENKTTLKAKGHTAGEWETTKKAGLFFKGTKEQKCSVCGEVLDTESIPSKLPFFVLPVIIVVAIVAIGGVVGFVIWKKKHLNDAEDEAEE